MIGDEEQVPRSITFFTYKKVFPLHRINELHCKDSEYCDAIALQVAEKRDDANES